jgi:hypothetical protein
MVLERFDAVVFVGDSSLQSIYNGLNILLRQDLAAGALKTWDTDKDTLLQCRCDRQFTSQACSDHFVTSSEDIDSHGGFACSSSGSRSRLRGRGGAATARHAFLHVDESLVPDDVVQKFAGLVPRVRRSNYRPVAIVLSLSPGTATPQAASQFLLHVSTLADAASRETPRLWVGPAAAGHVDVKGRLGNQEIWDFDRQLAAAATAHGADVLGVWNLTVQAASWDGRRFGERVALVQAMMVVNWLARVESS